MGEPEQRDMKKRKKQGWTSDWYLPGLVNQPFKQGGDGVKKKGRWLRRRREGAGKGGGGGGFRGHWTPGETVS